MYLKLISFLVLFFAFFGNGSSSAFVHTIQFLENTSESSERSARQVKEEVIYLIQEQSDFKSNVTYKTEKSGYYSFSHANFSLDKLTFYYTSRLRA